MKMHLGHGGNLCPSRFQCPDTVGLGLDEWADIEDSELPAYLQPPKGSTYFTIVDVTGIHYMDIKYCVCPNAAPLHIQLLRSRMFPSTIENPRTVFTFAVLDDFVRDNVECGTSASNYFSKLRRITTAVFPKKLPVRIYSRMTTIGLTHPRKRIGTGIF